MQIREITFQELETVYDVVCEGYPLMRYDTFEDLIYDMRHMNYTMFGIFEKEMLVTYAGVAIQTTLQHQRHLAVFELLTRKSMRHKGYGTMMLEYLEDYAKMGMCSCVLAHDKAILDKESTHNFLQQHGFKPAVACYLLHIS